MVILRNPSIEFFRAKNPREIVRSLENLSEQIGIFENSDGDIEKLFLTSDGDADELDRPAGRIVKAYRGSLVQETKEVARTQIPRHYKGYYPIKYYGIESTRGKFVLISARQKSSGLVYDILRKNGFDLRRVGLGRSVQDKLCEREDMFFWSSSIDDEVEVVTGKLKVSSRSTDTPLKGAKIEKLIDKRGRNRDQGITWKETTVRPKIVFWINSAGRFYVKKMEIDDAFILELIDIIIGVL